MRERPIPCNSEMAKAILDDDKSMTRRVSKFHCKLKPIQVITNGTLYSKGYHWEDGHGQMYKCPYGVVGDRLWVKETWQHSNFDYAPYEPSCDIFYRADYLGELDGPDGEGDFKRTWQNLNTMPRIASRILLEIINIKYERLNDISENDAIAEGILSKFVLPDHNLSNQMTFDGCIDNHNIGLFAALWESIKGKGSWAINPWVWVIEFRRIEP